MWPKSRSLMPKPIPPGKRKWVEVKQYSWGAISRIMGRTTMASGGGKTIHQERGKGESGGNSAILGALL